MVATLSISRDSLSLDIVASYKPVLLDRYSFVSFLVIVLSSPPKELKELKEYPERKKEQTSPTLVGVLPRVCPNIYISSCFT